MDSKKYEFKGTSAPWSTDGFYVYMLTETAQTIVSLIERPIHDIPEKPERLTKRQAEANAHLIAAAPELLEACGLKTRQVQHLLYEVINMRGQIRYSGLLECCEKFIDDEKQSAIHKALNINKEVTQ